MKNHNPTTIFLVVSNEDDRCRVRDSLMSLQFDVREFETVEQFMQQLSHAKSGCIISSLRLPGASGLELQLQLSQQGSSLPVILLARKASTQIVVRAMRSGVIAVLDVPVNEDELWLAVREAVAENARRDDYRTLIANLADRFNRLSGGEQKVLSRICQGLTNKEIASLLDVSVRTVESRKRRLLEKTSCSSLAELLLTYQQFKDLREIGCCEHRRAS